jgi:hypothetical protein
VLETPHAVIGAAIALKVGNPALALPLALGSHFVIEKIPHWNPHLNTEKKTQGKISNNSLKIILADSILALVSGGAIAATCYPDIKKVAIVLAGAFLAVLPDLIEAPYYFLNKESKFITKWIKFKKSIQQDAEVLPGIIYQIITVLVSMWWALS